MNPDPNQFQQRPTNSPSASPADGITDVNKRVLSDTNRVPLPSAANNPIPVGETSELNSADGESSGSPTPLASRATGSPFSGFFWFMTLLLLIVAAWRIGPRIIEDYQYASTLGKIRAEYDHAGQLLQDSPLEDVSLAFQLVAQRVRPSVVSVRTNTRRGTNPGLGSGVVISEQGYIVTNAHVVKDSDQFFIELHDKRRYRAELVGADDHTDLAVLKIEADHLIPAEWGDSEKLNVGSMVWAVGSPFEYEQTVTSGIVSGKNRQDADDLAEQNMLQTDAAISPGSSGGPLVDANGMVVGINTSIYGKTFQGISFAVPSRTAEFVINQLISTGQVSRGYLGVRPTELNQEIASRLGLPDLDGALLTRVYRDQAAYQSGLRDYDVIRTWNGKPIREYKTLYREVGITAPNTTVDVTVIRERTEQHLKVTVGRRPQ